MSYTKITISGQICTGKTTLYRALEKKLKWKAYATGQFFRDYAAKHQLSIEQAEEQNTELTRKVDFKIRDMLKTKKHIIVEGWLAGIMANDFPQILKVLLTCNNKERAKRFAKREKAKILISKNRIEERESKWLAEIYKIHKLEDIFNPKHYDLVINTTNLTPKQILLEVVRALNP